MAPPAGESYLRLVDSGIGSVSIPRPFSTDWSDDTYRLLDQAEEDTIKRVNEGWDEALAVSLDKAVNSTSLMLVFRVGRAHLLFSGDAQWGTWRVALDDPEWRGLLARTRFYKVGHHGSHNATPIEFIEHTLEDDPDFCAMISVKSVTRWPHIPRQPLIDALKTRTKKVVRSDKENRIKGFKRQRDIWVETVVPTR
jgi:beta-lactamase superfamily II metal-dependent hydrolase